MNATFKKVLTLVLVAALSATIAIGGTLAYLTDRDNDTNVFTMGNVEIKLNNAFEKGAELMPGKEISMMPTITNTGDNDAWVFLTFSIPAAFDNWEPGTDAGSNKNVIHWNPLGATTEGYVTKERVEKAVDAGLLPTGTTADQILNDKTTWNVFNNFVEYEAGKYGNCYSEPINNVQYNTYVLPYNKALTTGETTFTGIYKVYLDARVDIDPDGNMYVVEDGKPTDLNWNVHENGNPIVYINAYGIQKDNFENVQEAFDAYVDQWGKLNGEHESPFAKVTVLNKRDVLTNAAGNATVLDKELKIDTTGSKMGIDFGEIISLDTAYQFEPKMTLKEGQASEYADWHADFVVSVNEDVPAYGLALAGYYDAWCSLNNDKWVALASDTDIEAGTEIRLVGSMGGITVSFEELCEYGNDGIGFLCGAVAMKGKTINGTTIVDAELEPGTTLTVELRLYEATGGSIDTETGNYITTGTYTYTFN